MKLPDRQDFFKIIYGVEAYLVDDLKEIVTGDKERKLTISSRMPVSFSISKGIGTCGLINAEKRSSTVGRRERRFRIPKERKSVKA